MPIDLDAYCRRIGYAGPRAPTTDVLRALHLLHPRAIAFENLDPLREHPVDLALEAVERKLVHGRRGGYCFEQNALFAGVLAALGFRLSTLCARVLWNQPPDARRPRTHMIVLVDLEEGPQVCDVGFGGMTLTCPLRLVPDMEQAPSHEPCRLAATDGGFRLEVRLGAEWRALYSFDLQPHDSADYEMANWYTSTFPTSHFRHRLIAALVLPEGRLALLDRTLTTHRLDGRSRIRTLGSVSEVLATLDGVFGVRPPDDPKLQAAQTRIVGAGGP
jgi:N-hydroxyarylamine O-acetyltransferase